MGNAFAKVFGLSKEHGYFLIVGPKNAGKQTLLSLIQQHPEAKSVGPHNDLYFHNFCVAHMDIGNTKIRPLLSHYYRSCDALVLLLDATDKVGLASTKEQLGWMFSETNEKLCTAPVLLLLNKNDLPDAMTPSEVVELLELKKVETLIDRIEIMTCSVLHNAPEALEAVIAFMRKASK